MGAACGKMCSPKEKPPGKRQAETSTTKAASRAEGTPAVPALATPSAPAQAASRAEGTPAVPALATPSAPAQAAPKDEGTPAVPALATRSAPAQAASKDEGTPAVPALATRSAPAKAPIEDKLANTAYVFETCDTDESGRLDEHELRFALNAFGVFPQPSAIVKEMGGLQDVDRDGFEKILARFQSGELPSERRHRTVPYALRGISLGQLEDLHNTFVASGWIQQQCDEFNLAYAEDIAAGKAYRMEANLYALDRFVIRPATNPECPESARLPKSLQHQANIPDATYKCSYCELLNPTGVCVDFFVSHFWGHLFADTMQALRGWARRSYKSVGKERPEDVVFWLCFLALNQHMAGDEVGSSPEMGPFNAALVRANGAIMVLDEGIRPFKRIWCLFEVYRLTMMRRHFRLVCSMGPVATLLNESTAEKKQEAIKYMRNIEEALSTVSAFEADATSTDDKYAIWHRIADPRVQRVPLSKIVESKMFGPNVFKRFDSTIRGLLATPLLVASLTEKDKDACIRAIALGAAFNREALDFLQTSGVDVTTVLVKVQRGESLVDWSLLHAAAFFGHLGGLELLVARGADVESRTSFDYTPLHLAASNSRPETCRRLVELKADVASVTPLRRSAISMASINSDSEVVSTLIQLGSPVDIRETDGSTPIMGAASSGAIDVMESLVKAGANIQEKNLKEQTPLSRAVQNNHTKAVQFLLDQRADVMDHDRRSLPSLHLAALGGYTEMVQLLLDARADVNQTTHMNKKGEVVPCRTAHKLALSKDHVETAALLKNAEEAPPSPSRGGRWRRGKRDDGEDAAASGETVAKDGRGQEEAAGAAILSALSGGAASSAETAAAAVPEPGEDTSKAGGKGRRNELGGSSSKDSLPRGGKGGGAGAAAAAAAASPDKSGGKSGSIGGGKGGAKAAWQPVPSGSAVQWEDPGANWGVREDAGGWWSGTGDEVDLGRGRGGGRRRRGRRGGADKVAPR